jgi:Protein of unknown function (DUF2742)
MTDKEAAAPARTATTLPTTGNSKVISSNAVSWWSVHEHVAPTLARVGSWPMVGTPEWCDLDDDDERKTAALLDAAQHWALRVETTQVAMAEASHEISAAADWTAVARSRFRHDSAVAHGTYYIPRRTVTP